MVRYISVDAGKGATKVTEYLPAGKGIRRYSFETKISPGDLRDDSIEKNTFVADIGGTVVKMGRGASGSGAELNTSKITSTHKLAVLAGIANLCSDNEEDTIYLASGLPAKEWAVVDLREQFKRFFPREPQTVKVKWSGSDTIHEKHFTIEHVYAYPESIGALLAVPTPTVAPANIYGVLDIGNLNLNATMWQGFDLLRDESITDELGAAPLIQGLSQELSANFSRCDERLVGSILKLKPKMRFLPSSDPSITERSHKFIEDYLLKYAERIKRDCDARKWSLDYMELTAIGGASTILHEQLAQVFGGRLKFLDCPAFANSYGYLRLMCSHIKEFGEDLIPLKEVEKFSV